jgi:hypothetical protein
LEIQLEEFLLRNWQGHIDFGTFERPADAAASAPLVGGNFAILIDIETSECKSAATHVEAFFRGRGSRACIRAR